MALIYLVVISSILCTCFGSSVIIIGAGPAGLAAAAKLLESGITNITILEAENRIGGRIHSVEVDGSFVDLGAEFCHGFTGNAVYHLVKDLNLLHYNVLDDPPKIYYSNGSKLDDKLTADVQNLVLTFDLGDQDKTGLSVGELFNQQWSKLLTKYANDRDKVKVLNEGLSCAQVVISLPKGCFSWFDASVEKHYKQCEGYQLNAWKGGGYRSILDILAKSVNINNVLLNKTVTRIDWNKEVVQLTTSDLKTYQASYVIFTPSIGVLKHQHERLFHPALPTTKIKAIEEIGFDGVMKIVVHFPRQWWRDEDDFFGFVWSDDDLKNIQSHFPATSTTNYSWVGHINILVRVPSNPKVRIARIAGEVVKELELLPLETVKTGISFVINRFLGKDYDLVEPDFIIRSSWYSNPNFRGAYSFEKAKYYHKDIFNQNILAEPLTNKGRPVVLFAGEATNPVHYSTVHGAIETGYREADRLLASFDNSV